MVSDAIDSVTPWLVLGVWTVVVLHSAMWLRLVAALCRPAPRGRPMHDRRTMVVLCLRGDDPFLEQTLRATLALNHSNYQLRLMVDHRSDPAMATVRRVLAEQPGDRVAVDYLRVRHSGCSLKCSALVQALDSAPCNVEFVALLDADVVPHADWLDHLLAPLHNMRVAATTGNRWYVPRGGAPGTVLRYMWNVGAVSQMVAMGIPWGGSMAFRLAFARQVQLTKKLKYTLCEDIVIAEAARRLGQRVQFVPEAIMLNCEDCRLGQLFRWISRQLLMVRLYNSAWHRVLALGMISFVSVLLGMSAIPVAAMAGGVPAVTTLGTSLLLAILMMAGEVVILDGAVRRVVRRRGTKVPKWRPAALLSGGLALVTVPLLYTLALWHATRLTVVDWRGIRYRIGDRRQVTMSGYHPYRETPLRIASPAARGRATALMARLAARASAAHESIY